MASLLALLVSLLLASLSHAEMIKWTTKSVPNFEEVRDAAYGNDTYVAVGDNNTILYSADGLTWSAGNLPPGLTCNLKSVVFAFDQFMASGDDPNLKQGLLLASLDGINWTEVTSDINRSVRGWDKCKSITNLFVAPYKGRETVFASVFGSSGESAGWYSLERIIFATQNGSSWTPNNFLDAWDDEHATSYFTDGNQVFIRGDDGWGSARFHRGGWLTDSVYELPNLASFAVGYGTYVGAGSNRRLVYGRSGDSFSNAVLPPVIADYSAVVFGRDLFVAVGTAGAVVVSYDLGRSWRRASVSGLQSVRLNGVRYVGGRFITYGGGRIITGQPINKRKWSTASLPSGAKPLTSLASNGKTIVAVGKSGQILYSTTGASWSKAAPATSRDLYRVIYDARTKAFYATGANGTLLRSSNGRSWQTIKTPRSGYYDGVARAGKALIAFGGTKGQFLQSSDGKKWTTGRETSLKFSGSIVGDGSAAYVFGPSGKLLIKRGNSKNWSVGKGASVSLSDLTIANKTIFATGANGRLFSTSQSRPGTWKSVDTRTSGALNGIAPNAGAAKQVAAVGQYGLVYSEPSRGKWRLEMLSKGAPALQAIIKFKNRWVVAGGRGSSAFISYTQQN